MTRPPEPTPPGSPPLPAPDHFLASDGYRTAYRLYPPAGPPRALVIALHGIQSHSGWYGWSSAKLAEAGFAVAYLDRRGSGVNPIDRGDAPHADRLVNDVLQFVAHLERNGFARMPRVLTAVSWGAKLAAAIAIRSPERFDGYALLTPGLCPKIRANVAQRAAIRAAVSFGAGGREVAIPLEDPALFTDSPTFRSFIRDDPSTLHRVTVRFLAAGLARDRLIAARFAAIRAPLLVQLAGRDKIIDNQATRRLFGHVASTDKTLIEFPDACHTLEFDPCRDEAVRSLVDWIDRIVSAGTVRLTAPTRTLAEKRPT